MELLEEQLSYKFKNSDFLLQALTYSPLPTPTSSPFNTRKRTCDHLKILGDAVIKLVTSQFAICVSPANVQVHQIVKIKEKLSNRSSQNLIGQTLQLDKKGIVITNLQPDQILSHLDTFVKSLFGAIFLDAGGSQKKGFLSCWKVFLKLWKPIISSYDEAKPLLSCFPEPKYSSQEFLKERFSNYKVVDLKLLEEKIGFKFLKQPHLLEQSMTHDSIEHFINVVENPNPRTPEFVHFQNLEFLGDSVLELVIMEYLYLRSSSADPLGQMLFFNRDTGQKLISSRFQIQVANKLQLGNFVIKPPQVGLTNYDDFVESLIGSIYIHAKAIGLRACAKVVLGIWGLEPSSEEDAEKNINEGVVQLNGAKNIVDIKENIKSKPTGNPNTELRASTSSQVATSVSSQVATSASSQVATSTPPVVVGQPSSSTPNKDLQAFLGYEFVNAQLLSYLPMKIDLSTTEARIASMNRISISKNLQVIGKRCIDLVVAEYVIGICHSSQTADLSAAMKKSMTKLMENLSSDQLLSDIFVRFKLIEYFNIQEDKIPNPTTSPSDVLHLIFGAVFVDSSGDHSKVQKLFQRIWYSFINGSQPEESLINCFPDTSEKQQIFRAVVNAKISDVMWKKLYLLLGHTFTHKNLLEQALTDEKSQGYAKQCLDAYPLANSFGLQVLGKRIIDLFSAQRCYLNTLAEPGNFTGVLARFDQSLLNTLKSRFSNLERYYANQVRYPFPPKKNPHAPYYAMMAATYVDVGGGVKGLCQIHSTILKACPTLLELKKAKPVKQAASTSEDCVEDVKIAVQGKEEMDNGEDRCVANSSGMVTLSNSPLKSSKNIPHGTNTMSGSQDALVKGSPLSCVFISASVPEDPLLSELQRKLAYRFVNSLHLAIVLEVDIPVGKKDDSEISGQKYFEVFRILGKRVLNLLATEFALESIPVSKNDDISENNKRQMEKHIEHLTSVEVLESVANSLELKKFIFTTTTSNKKSTQTTEDLITALLGAVFIDSRANYLKVSALFNKFWKLNMNATQPRLAQCFPSTSEAQLKLRSATSTFHTDCKWRKLYRKLGYAFKNVNLLEQALTDEGSQELARTKLNAYPTGAPFALRLLGRCVVELVIAYKTLPTSLSANAQVDGYLAGLLTIEKAMYNSFKNNFLGTEKYYACIKQKKKQQFPPKINPLGPYEAILGAVFVDAGAGNPGLDTVGVVIIQRNIGVKASQAFSGVLNTGSNLSANKLQPAVTATVAHPVPVAATVLCASPVPSTSSCVVDNLNTSFSTKCAANFGFSPVQLDKSLPQTIKSPIPYVANTTSPTILPASPQTQSAATPKNQSVAAASPKSQPNSLSKQVSTTVPSQKQSAATPLSQKQSAAATPLSQKQSAAATPVSQKQSANTTASQKQPATSTLPQDKLPTSPQKSPKKKQTAQQNSYASVVINGQTENRLIIAVTNAQSEIQALQKKQECIDWYRKRTMEKEKLEQQAQPEQDEVFNDSTNRSRCASTSTIGSQSVSVQQQSEPGKKRKRGSKNGKKQNKKAKPAQQPPEQVDVSPHQTNSQRVSAWCQNQLEIGAMSPSASSSVTGASSLCTAEVHQQRSMIHQKQNTVEQECVPNEIALQPSPPTAESSHNSHVPVNMVSGYRKSTVEHNGRVTDTRLEKKGTQSQNKSCGSTTIATGCEDAPSTDPPSSFSYMGVLKWTSLILGVAYLLTRYKK